MKYSILYPIFINFVGLACTASVAAETAKSSGVELKKASSILDLQDYKSETSVNLTEQGNKATTARLININPNVNISYLLELKSAGVGKFYNIHNPSPDKQRITLDTSFLRGLTITTGGRVDRCELWDESGKTNLAALLKSQKPYQPLCDEKLNLVVPVEGRSTPKEVVADFLRRNIWQGEQITTLVKNTFFKDSFLQVAEETKAGAAEEQQLKSSEKSPFPARINKLAAGVLVKTEALDLPLKNRESSSLPIGEWFSLTDYPHIFVSVMEPGRVSEDILTSRLDRAGKLDEIERKAMVILVAYDLSQYDLGFLVGTEHPSLNWSPRASFNVRPKGWNGPDGFETRAPIVSVGMLSPQLTQQVVSTFTGGFKRYHSAFKYGPLAQINRGSHYGFIENGILHSRMQPGLATISVDNTGRVNMKTWTADDEAQISVIRHARQNGVPIVEWDESAKSSIPGQFVNNWGEGNWSGADNKTMRALRAGLCLQEANGRQYLVYGYFTSVTPSAMARVFQAYGCKYAMHLDMNALEHTYLAVYRRSEEGSGTFYLNRGMKVLDETGLGAYVPRFVGMPDNRDFFYLVPKPKIVEE